MLSTRAFRVASILIGPRTVISRGGGTFSRLAAVRHLSTLDIPPPPTSHHPYKAMPGAKGTIMYTETDEAPALATYSLLPVIAKVCTSLHPHKDEALVISRLMTRTLQLLCPCTHS